MAGFRTHITTSTVLGVGYGAAGYFALEAPLGTSLLAAGLCGVSGMLPDIDSDSGIPLRESIAFAAAVVPMLLIDRLKHLGLDPESIVLAGALIYIAIRFGVAEIIKRYTVHRGMWHSLPACAIAGLLAYMLCTCDDLVLRLFKTGAVVLGFMSHLLLDEIYAVKVTHGVLRFKKSFGTAIKLWSNSTWANVSTYGKLALIILVAFGEPLIVDYFDLHDAGAVHAHREGEASGVADRPSAADGAGDGPPPMNDSASDEDEASPRTARDWFDRLIQSAEGVFR
jgi:hypothetical protein